MSEAHPTIGGDTFNKEYGRGLDIFVLALARDCEATLPGFFSWLKELERNGIHPITWVGENGSTDKTKQLLHEAAGARFHVLDTGFMAAARDRLTRMAIGRQALLDAIAKSELAVEFVCVLDLDNVMVQPPSPKDLRRALNYLLDPRTFAVGATSKPYYYDLLSLKSDWYDGGALQAEIEQAKKHPTTYFQFYRDRIYKVQQSFDLSTPKACESSFNGMCLYKKAAFLKGSYRHADEAYICEHVSLNLSIAQETGTNMLIVPELCLVMPPDHGPTDFFGFWVARVRKLFHR